MMHIEIATEWVLAVFYTAVRIGVLLLSSPVFSGLGGLVTVRVLVSIALSALLVQGLHLPVPATPPDLAMVVAGTCNELLVGGTMAFGVFAAFGAFSVAGKLLDVQTGLGLGAVYDPVTRTGAPLFGTMLNMLGVVVFFGLDGHHAWLRGIAFSLDRIPPGTALGEAAGDAMLMQFGLMFSLGVALVIPVLLCLLLVETVLAFISRVLPQMNVFVVGVPVKIVAGMLVLALTVVTLGPPMGKVYAAIFQYWQQVLG